MLRILKVKDQKKKKKNPHSYEQANLMLYKYHLL